MFIIQVRTLKIFTVSTLVLANVVINQGCYANDTEKKFMEAGLVDVHEIDKSILVDLVNSDKNKNYFREDFYGGLTKAYLRKEVAERLSRAQKFLKAEISGYSIQIMDAARPRSVSKRMYDKMKGTNFEKFVANPNKGSMHNYGIAVDVTVVDDVGKEIDMGFTPFYKSDSSIFLDYAKVKLFDITEEQKRNRLLLSRIMKKAGFIPLSYEWWHFNGMKKSEARNRYKIIE